MIASQSKIDDRAFGGLRDLSALPGTLCSTIRCSQAQAQVAMANDLLDKIPAWLKSLWDMENELRSAARNGLILRTDEASAHLAKPASTWRRQ